MSQVIERKNYTVTTKEYKPIATPSKWLITLDIKSDDRIKCQEVSISINVFLPINLEKACKLVEQSKTNGKIKIYIFAAKDMAETKVQQLNFNVAGLLRIDANSCNIFAFLS